MSRTGGDQPPRPSDTPPVQEGNLNRHTEENLTALLENGGGVPQGVLTRSFAVREPRGGSDAAHLAPSFQKTGMMAPFTGRGLIADRSRKAGLSYYSFPVWSV